MLCQITRTCTLTIPSLFGSWRGQYNSPGAGGGGGTWVKFCWVCAAGISEPLPHYSLFLVYFVANYKPHVSHFWANDFLTQSPEKVRPHSSNSIENA